MDCNKVNIVPGINESMEGSEVARDNNKVFENYVAGEIDKLDMQCYRNNYNNYWDNSYWNGEKLDVYAPVHEDKCNKVGKYDIDDEYQKYASNIGGGNKKDMMDVPNFRTLEYRHNAGNMDNKCGGDNYPQGIFSSQDIYVDPSIRQEYNEYDKYDVGVNMCGRGMDRRNVGGKGVSGESNGVGIGSEGNGGFISGENNGTRASIIDKIKNIATPYLMEAEKQLQQLNIQNPIVPQNTSSMPNMLFGSCIVIVIIILLIIIFWMITRK